MLFVTGTIGKYTDPSFAKSIDCSAFQECIGLSSVTVLSNATQPSHSFSVMCSFLASVFVSTEMIATPPSTFVDCAKLKIRSQLPGFNITPGFLILRMCFLSAGSIANAKCVKLKLMKCPYSHALGCSLPFLSHWAKVNVCDTAKKSKQNQPINQQQQQQQQRKKGCSHRNHHIRSKNTDRHRRFYLSDVSTVIVSCFLLGLPLMQTSVTFIPFISSFPLLLLGLSDPRSTTPRRLLSSRNNPALQLASLA